MRTWLGEFGREYTDRNALSMEEMEALYKQSYGFTRTELNKIALEDLDRSTRILEVGANIGVQLSLLQNMGYTKLYGVELQSYAVELAKSRTEHIHIIQGSAFDLPFKNEEFDLVFTSGVLIHVHPDDVSRAMAEIHRCTKKYIWGLEHYAAKYTEIMYRGRRNLLWNFDYVQLYRNLFPNLELLKERRLKYVDSDKQDAMFMLRKK
jgi:pseudaminic acid biosynthesis-associated methylase